MSQIAVNAKEIVECPICMDEINGEKNKVTTDCGHCFHTSCLMKNVAHNGFSCPYCRDAMAEEPADNNSDEEYDEFSIDEEEEGPDYNDNVLRGARWLFQRAEGEEVDDDEDSVLDEEEVPVEAPNRPSVNYIVEKLVQGGVTMADLLKSVLLFDHEEFQDEETFERGDNELFGKLRIIISNYQPPVIVAPAAVVEEIPTPVVNYETNHYQSSRLRQIDAFSEDEIYIDDIDAQLCNSFYVSEREKRYEKISSESILAEKKEERVIKMPFSFQMKGACRHKESIF
jgi:hypothetical protein